MENFKHVQNQASAIINILTFFWYQELNLGTYTCKATIIPLSYNPHPSFCYLFPTLSHPNLLLYLLHVQRCKVTRPCITHTLSPYRLFCLPAHVSFHFLSPHSTLDPKQLLTFHHFRIELPFLGFSINRFCIFCGFIHSAWCFWDSPMLLHGKFFFFNANYYSIIRISYRCQV